MVSRGFTLLEVVVSLTILGFGVLGVAAASALAARMLREAESREAAVAAAALVLDSLLQDPQPGPGERRVRRARLRWDTRAEGERTVIDLTVEYTDGTAARRLEVGAVYVPAPRTLRAAP